MSYKLLLVDDDREILQLNAKYLSTLNYNVKICTHPSIVPKLIEEYNPDCIILDIMMPELDGRSLCTKIRQTSDVPILFLSGKTTENDKIQGLQLGADDYITKPYSFRELEARIQTHIRRHKSAITSTLLRFPPLSIDTRYRKAFYHDEDID
jgi:DNA-binding response OmpR family regulator